MKKEHQWTQLAVAAILSAGIGVVSSSAIAAEEPAMEKCYGIAKKGMNQCATPSHSCAGTSTVDDDPNEWIYEPVGTCTKLGGTLKKEE